MLILSIYIILVFNIHYWRYLGIHVPFGIHHNIVLWLTMPFFMLASMNLCLQLLFWPWLHKIMVPILLIVGAAASYAVMTQGIYFDADMVQNIIQTNPAEAGAWLTPMFLLWLTLTGILPAIGYVWKIHVRYHTPWYKEVGWRLASVGSSILILLLITVIAYPSYASFFRNNKSINHQISPINVIGSVVKTAYNEYDRRQPLQKIGLDATHSKTSSAKRVLVIVLGETTRAENWGLNGTPRQTTPQLAAQGTDVINFPQVSSCGTATAVSVPCLFSNMRRQHYDANLAAHQEGLMDILQHARLYTSWRDNDGGCKGVCDRIKHIIITQYAPASQCRGDGCLDMNLLTGLTQEIDAMPDDGVIVLHSIGSHGPAYYQRYPPQFRQFTPTCDTNQIQQCSNEQLRNTYDNTILYIDHMLTQTIDTLKQQKNIDAAVWYFSDHGESLSEKGMYLHATPYAIAPSQQTHIPMIFWANAGFYQHTGLNQRCLAQKAQTKAFSHDYIFHSVLGIMDVKTRQYDRNLDMFAACREPQLSKNNAH